MSEQLPLYWDDSYTIARLLSVTYPGTDLEQVSLGDIYRWTVGLEGFKDLPELANDSILNSIFTEWLEILLD